MIRRPHMLPSVRSRAAVRRFYQEIDIRHLGIYLAEDLRAMQAFGVIGLPTTLLVDRDGREIARVVGPAEWNSPEAVAQFQSVIATTRN